MVNLFRAQGAEVHVATADMALKGAPQKTSTADTVRRAVDTMAPAGDAAARAADTVAGAGVTVARAADSTMRPARTPSRAAPVTVRTGDWIVRLDQPYSATVRTLLAIQKFKADDPPPYDDTGWTLDELRHVVTHKISDSTILAKPMTLLTADAKVEGSISGDGGVVLVEHL